MSALGRALQRMARGKPKQTTLPPAEEKKFQTWARALPWFSDFKKRNGGEPNLDDPNYDYRAAFKAGIEPKIYKHDGTYHWPSVTPEGKELKGKNHPTRWMEDYMQATGRDPNDDGVTKDQWERMKRRGNNGRR